MDDSSLSSHQERMERIFQLVVRQGSVRVTELQDLLKVSDMTVRRCLNMMAADGLIKRVHGGACAVEGGEIKFVQIRNSLHTNTKTALANRALDFMPDHGSIFLDSGTTCFAVAKSLATSGKKLNIITDSIKVLRELQGVRHLNTMILGGALSDDMTTLDGNYTADAAARVTVDVCFFSADGFTGEQLENKYLIGAMTKRIVISRSSRSICICDSSKFNKRCCFKFCGWEEVGAFLSDSHLPEFARDQISEKGVGVHVVQVPALEG